MRYIPEYDSPAFRCLREMLTWKGSLFYGWLTQAAKERHHGGGEEWRRVTSNKKRDWDGVMVAIGGDNWVDLLGQGIIGVEKFIEGAMKNVGLEQKGKTKRAKTKGVRGGERNEKENRGEVVKMATERGKKRRVVRERETIEWGQGGREIRVCFQGDSEVVVGAINGWCRTDKLHLQDGIGSAVRALMFAYVRGLCQPHQVASDWLHHVQREYNKDADALATLALTRKRSKILPPEEWVGIEWGMAIGRIRGGFDGGHRKGHGGAGWWIDIGGDGDGGGEEGEWVRVVEDYIWMRRGTVNEAESLAAQKMIISTLLIAMHTQAEKWRNSKVFDQLVSLYRAEEQNRSIFRTE